MSRELLERESEVAVLSEALDRLRDSVGGAVAIEGPPGIGKTALLEHAVSHAGEDVQVLRARCGEFELDFPFGVARQLLERPVLEAPAKVRRSLLGGAAAHAVPALGAQLEQGSSATPVGEEPGADLPFTVIHGLYWLLANMAERGPLIVAVDDAQWCDEASLRLLSYLVPRLGELPMLLVVTSRPADLARAAAMGGVLGGPGVERIVPAPLGVDGSSALLQQVLDTAVESEFAFACHEASGGNPFLLSELASSLVADRIEPVGADADRVLDLVPAAVVNSVLIRIGGLPQACSDLAAAIAILGAEVEPRHAATLAGLAVEDIADPLERLERAGIIARDRPLRFVHPLLREAVRAELPVARREQLHGSAARLLRAEGARPGEIAHHLLDAPREGARETVTTLREAATNAVRRGAPEAAITYLLRALAEPPEADLKAALRYELGMAGWLSGGDPAALIENLRAGLDGAWSATERATRSIALARALATVGDVPGAFAILDDQLDAAGTGSGEAAARLRAEHGSLGLLHPDTRERAIARIVARQEPEGDEVGALLELAVLATLRSLDGSADEAAELASRAVADGALLAAEGADSLAFYVALLVLMTTDRHELSEDLLEQAARQARRGGSVFAFGSVSAMSAVLAWRRGDMATAEAQARSGLEVGLAPIFTYPLMFACLTLALIDRGELDAAEEEAARTGAGPDLPELMQVNMAFFARGELRLAQGRWQEALDDYEELDRRNVRLGIENPAVPWRCGAVEACLRLSRPEDALAHAAAEGSFAERWGTNTARGQALRAAGLAKGADGIGDLREAVEVLAESPARRERTLALLNLGSALRRAGQRKEARDRLRECLDLAQACGATRLAELAHAELRVAGAKPRRLQFSGLESLTAGERRVAEMAAEGLANREIAETLFLSTRTVENHLSRTYRKLDIASRDELGRALVPEPV